MLHLQTFILGTKERLCARFDQVRTIIATIFVRRRACINSESDSKSIAIINIGSKSHFWTLQKNVQNHNTLDHTHSGGVGYNYPISVLRHIETTNFSRSG